MVPEFRNEPLTDFSEATPTPSATPSPRSRGASAARPNRVDGERVPAGQHFEPNNPSDSEVVIGRFPEAAVEDAVRAVEAATRRSRPGAACRPSERAALFLRTARSCAGASTSSPR